MQVVSLLDPANLQGPVRSEKGKLVYPLLVSGQIIWKIKLLLITVIYDAVIWKFLENAEP